MSVVLVASPIGDPCDYQLVKYYIEKIEGEKRSVKELRRRYSYTGAALKHFASEFWEDPKVVDALYIAPISLALKTCRDRRIDAFDNFLKLIKSKGAIGYDDLAKIAREYVEMLEPETYGKVVVVPALLTSMRGGRLYTFVGGEEALNAALAIVVKSVYQKLKELRGERVVILLDTTHGLNYMVPYVVEGVDLAASLYYLTLEKGEVTVWRYNSDPIEEGVETAKLHLVDVTELTEQAAWSYIHKYVTHRACESLDDSIRYMLTSAFLASLGALPVAKWIARKSSAVATRDVEGLAYTIEEGKDSVRLKLASEAKNLDIAVFATIWREVIEKLGTGKLPQPGRSILENEITELKKCAEDEDKCGGIHKHYYNSEGCRNTEDILDRGKYRDFVAHGGLICTKDYQVKFRKDGEACLISDGICVDIEGDDRKVVDVVWSELCGRKR
ncbi:MAG: hypothetical protein ACPL3C_01015 [Pyrobaculum sp.]